jgi:predicted AlkP superfamily pyrophosphatase or phosphodiesterase
VARFTLPVFFFYCLFLVSCLPKGKSSDPRVVLISIDGLRADIFLHPEVNGFSTEDLPNLNKMAAEGHT